MKTINAIIIDDILTPVEPLPTDALKIVFDGEKYVIYELGDKPPSEPIYDEQL